MPRSLGDAKIALINSAIEVKKTEVDAKIQITDPNMLAQFLDEEEAFLKGLVDTIIASGANVVICQKGIDDLAQHTWQKLVFSLSAEQRRVIWKPYRKQLVEM